MSDEGRVESKYDPQQKINKWLVDSHDCYHVGHVKTQKGRITVFSLYYQHRISYSYAKD